MAINITIDYPDVSDSVDKADLDILKSYESTIKDACAGPFNTDAPLVWESSMANEYERYYVLKKKCDNEVLIEKGIKVLQRKDFEAFKIELIDLWWKNRE